MDFSEYNWNDHNCRSYEANAYSTPFTTPPSDLVRPSPMYSAYSRILAGSEFC